MRRRAVSPALAALAAAAAALAGCSRLPAPPGPDVVARLAGADLRYAEFEEYLRSNLGESGGALASETLSRLFDAYLTEESLRRLAVERGLAAADAPRAAATESLLASAPPAAPAAAEIAAYYAAHTADFRRPERVELRQILTEDRRQAERARRELAAGTRFEEVVSRLTGAGHPATSGDQGTLARDELPPAFAELVFRLQDGGVSEVLAADYGFHVFQVVRRLPAETLPLEAAREEIVARLAAAGADAALARFVSEARSRYAVEVFDRNLPFNYRGAFPVARPYEAR